MEIEVVVTGYLEENCYLLKQNGQALIVDPGDEFLKIKEKLKGVKPLAILITHHHFDHVGALEELETFYSLKANVKSCVFDYEVIKTPGHTSDSISFYFPELGCVFVGDFIFKDGIGRTDLGGNDFEMKKSIQMFLKRFSDNTVLYPGHGVSTTLGAERSFLEYIKSN